MTRASINGPTSKRTRRLDLEDTDLFRCAARILAIRSGALVLDRTVFNPGTVICPADIGRIGGRRVTAAKVVDGELRYHVTSTHWLCPGEVVAVEIEPKRRMRLATHNTLAYLMQAYMLDRCGLSTAEVRVDADRSTVEVVATRFDLNAAQHAIDAVVTSAAGLTRRMGEDVGADALQYGEGPVLPDGGNVALANAALVGSVALRLERTTPQHLSLVGVSLNALIA